MRIVADRAAEGKQRRVRIAIYAAWLVAVLWLVSRHVMWRDEVRALSIALAGDDVFAMLRGLHGEGHPAIWYLMLRGADWLVPVREVLPATALLVAMAATAILVFRSPFRPWLLALILAGRFALTEYPVVARNYGIAMLGLFALAWLYPRHRDRGVTIGLLLAFLCNTNVPATFLAAAFLLFWLVELVAEEGLAWGPKYRLFLVNAAIAAAGALLCFVTVFPTVHDAAPLQHPPFATLSDLLAGLARPTTALADPLPRLLGGKEDPAWVGAVMALVLLACLAGLARRPAAFLSALAASLVFTLFFWWIYPAYYRHEALLIVYLVVVYWLAAEGRGGRWRGTAPADAPRRLEGAGTIGLLLLLAVQVASSVMLVAAELDGLPYSRSRQFAELLRSEHLTNAVLIADPDVMLETMPYYASNPIYLMREQRFGTVDIFKRDVRQDLSLDDYLRDGRALQRRTGRPVVILLEYRLRPGMRPFRRKSGFNWSFSGTDAQIRRFFASTRRLASFDAAVSGEAYDIYLLDPEPGPAA